MKARLNIPDPITIDGRVYEPLVIQRNGVPNWSGRWARLIRPTPIAWSINMAFNRINLGTLYLVMPTRELPKQLR